MTKEEFNRISSIVRSIELLENNLDYWNRAKGISQLVLYGEHSDITRIDRQCIDFKKLKRDTITSITEEIARLKTNLENILKK